MYTPTPYILYTSYICLKQIMYIIIQKLFIHYIIIRIIGFYNNCFNANKLDINTYKYMKCVKSVEMQCLIIYF